MKREYRWRKGFLEEMHKRGYSGDVEKEEAEEKNANDREIEARDLIGSK